MTCLAWFTSEIRRVEREGLVHHAGSLLVDGQWEAARHALSADAEGTEDDAHLATLSTLLDASEGRLAEAPVDGLASSAVDAARLPLPLMVRAAFERGEFEQAQHLTQLSETLGQPNVAALQVALAIESGQMVEAPSQDLTEVDVDSRLLDRLEGFAKQSQELAGHVLRDRQGRPIATFDGRELRLLDGVRPEWVPRAVQDLMAGHDSVGSLRSSLDLELSAAAYGAFGRYVRGSIVIVDPENGDILAAVSDRHTYRQGGTPAFEQFREPASVAKLMTSTATLRAGLDPEEEIRHMECRGHERYAGEFLYCPHIAGRLRGLNRAMAVSCNVAFANLGVHLGRDAMLEELSAYGFDGQMAPFPGARILQPRGDDRQLADLSIGLEATEITPLHGALMAAVMANDGVMPRPRLLISEDGRLGLHPRPFRQLPGEQVIDAEWLPQILASMEAVASRGTGRGMASRSFPVAMKTGTASHPMHGFHVNYIGIGPMPEARLAFCVRITDQPTSRKVRAAARDVTTRLLRNLGRIADRRGWNGPGVRSTDAPTESAKSWNGGRRIRPRPSVDDRIGRR